MSTIKRQIAYTDVEEINSTNIVDVLKKAYNVHQSNLGSLKFLFDYEDGIQPILRKKTYRPSINVECVDNVAHEVTKFHVGYEWGNPITLIQRGEQDSGSTNESLAIALLNEQYEIEGNKTKTQKLGKDVTICNLGYTHVDINTDWVDGDSYFKVNVLSPFTTFIVYSSRYLDKRKMLAVTYREDDDHMIHFTCYTKYSRFEISDIYSSDARIYEEANPLNNIPIVKWIGNYDGMGIWEHEISEMNNLNLMISDFSNNVEQNMQAVWHANDVDLGEEEIELEDGTKKKIPKRAKNGDWVFTFTAPDGKTPFVKPLTIDYDFKSQLDNISARRNLILQKCYTPQRNDDSGGSTGVAMQSAAGWSALDIVSESIQACQESAKMEEVKLVLEAIRQNPNIPSDSPLLVIKAKDIQPNIKRQKLAEMATKINSLVSLIKIGVNGKSAIESVNYFPDPNQVWEDSKESIIAFQQSQLGNSKEVTRNMQDESDQSSNSPFVGM